MYCYKYCFKLGSLWRKEHVRWEKYTRTALLLNPNITTFWNYRKKMINCGVLNHDIDLMLTKIIISWKPKCVEALTHRRWLLKTQMKSLAWVENELNLCTQMADKVKCNYHSWSHRQWIFNICNCTAFNLTLWISEYQSSEAWTQFHLSDHSGWHYRKFLLQQLKKNLNQVEDKLDDLKSLANGASVKTSAQLYVILLNEELRKNEDLLLRFIGHETLWYYRRFLIQIIESFLPWIDESFLDRCLHSSKSDSNQQRCLENHRRWLSKCV